MLSRRKEGREQESYLDLYMKLTQRSPLPVRKFLINSCITKIGGEFCLKLARHMTEDISWIFFLTRSWQVKMTLKTIISSVSHKLLSSPGFLSPAVQKSALTLEIACRQITCENLHTFWSSFFLCLLNWHYSSLHRQLNIHQEDSEHSCGIPGIWTNASMSSSVFSFSLKMRLLRLGFLPNINSICNLQALQVAGGVDHSRNKLK